jgi:hypothetical protein
MLVQHFLQPILIIWQSGSHRQQISLPDRALQRLQLFCGDGRQRCIRSFYQAFGTLLHSTSKPCGCPEK